MEYCGHSISDSSVHIFVTFESTRREHHNTLLCRFQDAESDKRQRTTNGKGTTNNKGTTKNGTTKQRQRNERRRQPRGRQWRRAELDINPCMQRASGTVALHKRIIHQWAGEGGRLERAQSEPVRPPVIVFGSVRSPLTTKSTSVYCSFSFELYENTKCECVIVK